MHGSAEVSFRGIAVADQIEGYVHRKVNKLDGLCRELISCNVMVEQLHHAGRTGNHYHVRVDLVVPGAELTANSSPYDEPSHQDIYAAINDSFSAARRQLLEYLDRRRYHVKRR